MTTIIVDDELQSHEVLRTLLAKDHPDIQLLSSAFNVAEGLQAVRAHQPDLVFLDIEMPDGTGFDLLETIGRPDFHVVFITAHNEFAISAIRFGALDFLLKPLTSDTLAAALARVREKQVEKTTVEQWRMTYESFQELKNDRLPTRMIVSTLEGIHYIPIDEIICLEAATNCTEIKYMGASKRLIASVNLGEYEEQFKPYRHFMRVHRSHLVNLLMVKSYLKGEGHLVLRDGTQARVSRTNQDEVLRRMQEL